MRKKTIIIELGAGEVDALASEIFSRLGVLCSLPEARRTGQIENAESSMKALYRALTGHDYQDSGSPAAQGKPPNRGSGVKPPPRPAVSQLPPSSVIK